MYEYSVKIININESETIMNEMAKNGYRVKAVLPHPRNIFKINVIFEKKNES